jgi:hypothetical protein
MDGYSVFYTPAPGLERGWPTGFALVYRGWSGRAARRPVTVDHLGLPTEVRVARLGQRWRPAS